MAINIEDKKQIVSEVNKAASGALSAVLADYRGIDVADMTVLRDRKSTRLNSSHT